MEYANSIATSDEDGESGERYTYSSNHGNKKLIFDHFCFIGDQCFSKANW